MKAFPQYPNSSPWKRVIQRVPDASSPRRNAGEKSTPFGGFRNLRGIKYKNVKNDTLYNKYVKKIIMNVFLQFYG
jgi:hypothetical protein